MHLGKDFSFCFTICSIILTIHTKANSNTGIAAITNPIADVTLSFVQPSRIAEVYIKEGEAVKADQVLALQGFIGPETSGY